MDILVELDKLRRAAMSGDVSAAGRAAKAIDFLRGKPVPPAEFRAARWLALETQGFALRHAADQRLLEAAAVTQLIGSTEPREQQAATVAETFDDWKARCDSLIAEAIAEQDDRLVPMLLLMRSSHHLQEVLSYVRVASWDANFKATLPAQYAEGIARARGARDGFAKLNIDEMRIRAMGVEMDWEWIAGNRGAAKTVASELARDAHAATDGAALTRARRVLAGMSPLPEWDAIPALA